MARWYKAIDLPKHYEGTECWCFYEWRDPQPGVYHELVPLNYSREPHHCEGVWWQPMIVPSEPYSGLILSLSKLASCQTLNESLET